MKLKDICIIQSGGTPSRSKKEYWENGTIPWVKISDFSAKHIINTQESITEQGMKCSSAKLFPKGTLLYTIFATIGEVGILDIDATTNQAIVGIMIKNSMVDQEYLYYYLMSLKDYVNRIGRGVAQNNINMSILRELEIPLPPIEKQKKISNIFIQLDKMIEQRQNQIDLIDELVKSRFIELFGDVIYNDKKWECKRFSDITTSRLGKMLDTKHQTGTCQYPYLANFNVQWFRFELNNLNEMDFDEKEQVEFCLKDGDLLVCEGGEIGRCAVWHSQIKKCFFQKALHRVRCNQKIILPDYLSWWFKYNCDNGGFSVIEGAKATISHLTGAKMKVLNVVVPPIELQEQFVVFLRETDKSKLAVQKSLDELETLKKSLMQEYFG